MISFIQGKVADSSENSIIVEAGGVGYEIFMTGASIEAALREKDIIKIHTYFHVREDAMQLYGFLTKDDLQVFRQPWEFWRGFPQMSFGSQCFPMTRKLYRGLRESEKRRRRS